MGTVPAFQVAILPEPPFLLRALSPQLLCDRPLIGPDPWRMPRQRYPRVPGGPRGQVDIRRAMWLLHYESEPPGEMVQPGP